MTATLKHHKPPTTKLGISISATDNRIHRDHMGDGLIPRSLRRIRKLWPLAYTKLLSLDWKASSVTPYGATDGRQLILNPAGLNNLLRTSNPVGLTSFLLVHEAMHALLNHGTRLRKFDDHQTANIAADYVINKLIKSANTEAMRKHNLSDVPFPFISGCLYDETLENDVSVEQLYQRLRADMDTQDPDTTPEDDNADTSNSDTDEDATAGDTSGGSEASDSSSDSNDDEGTGGYGGDSAFTDEDILGGSWVGTAGGEDTFEPEVDTLNGESAEDVEREITQTNERVILMDELNAKAGVGGSSSLRDIRQQNKSSQAPRWNDLIRDWFSSRSNGGWNKPCNVPLYQSTRLISAGRETNSIGTWVMVVDTSGSMSDRTLQDVLANVQDAINTIKPAKTVLLPVDHTVHEAHEITHGQQVPLTLAGGGGTLFQIAFDHIADYYPDAEGIVYLTDGWAADFHNLTPPNIPLLWLTYGKDESTYPCGDAINVELYR